MKRNLFTVLLLSLLMVGFAGATYASPIVYLKTTGVNPSSAGSFYFAGLNDVNVYYGQYNLAIDYDAAGPMGYEAISGFCVENAWATSTDNVQYELLSPSAAGQGYRYSAYILSQYEAGNITARAAQIAVWEAVLDPDSVDVQTGALFHANFSNDYTLAAEAFLATMYATNVLSGFDSSGYAIARSPVYSQPGTDPQDYVIHVPDASIMFLLGPALLGLGLLGQRKRRSSPA